MSEATHNPVSEQESLVTGAKCRSGSPSVVFEQDLRIPIGGGTIPPSTRSRSGPDGSDFVDIEQLPRDVGWLLFSVGFAGFVAPGVFGLPFMVGGGMILWPKTTKRLSGLLGEGSPKVMNAGVKQILRFLDDLEKRYPHI